MRLCVGGRLTGCGEQHGDGGEGPGEALAAHEYSAVVLRQQADQAEQAALQHGAERCGPAAPSQRVQKQKRVLLDSLQTKKLTVDEPDDRHGDGEEEILMHVHFHQDCGEDEEQQDEDEAACDADGLRYPGTENILVIGVAPGPPGYHQGGAACWC